MPLHVAVLRADDSDLAALIALRYRWQVEERGESGRTLEEFEREFLDWFDDHRSTHQGYVASIDAEPVGCAWLYIIDRVPGPGKFVRRAGMLQSVYVQPEFRSDGIGSQLIRCLIDDATSMELDYLMVHPSQRSFEFYRRLGFGAADRVLELRRA
jgi:ribosomal protein S18 acetylase RimI-like enzyme